MKEFDLIVEWETSIQHRTVVAPSLQDALAILAEENALRSATAITLRIYETLF
jgi:hypothetical protein